MADVGLLGARYELGELLGQGGMAEVRLGKDTRLGRVVAVKTLRTDLATDPTFQARFRREAQSAAALNHPDIVAVYDTGEQVADGVSVPYIVMEYVEGRTLRDILREGRRILPERALEITADVLAALEYSHRAGIIHRDIKPANVMLTPTGDVKVMDFGIARAVADTSATMTQTAAVIGTAQYLSPEQARGETVDSRSDIYSTGCLLYELLTHRPPFTGESPVSVAYQHVREDPRPPSMIDPEVPEHADAICLKALAKRPADRYQTAGDMRADIDRALSGQALAVTTVTPAVEATSRFQPATAASDAPAPPVGGRTAAREEAARKRRRKWYIALALLTVLAIAGVIAALIIILAPGEVEDIQVPRLVGETQEDAEQLLATRGFPAPEIVSESHPEVEAGRVFQQDPDADAFVPPTTVVQLTVSLGKPEVEIPNVMGLQVDEARERLEDQGFKVTTEEDESSDQDEGLVIAVAPEVGQMVADGTTVTLTYSAGLIAVPNVVGESEDVATALLQAAGFEVDSTEEVVEDVEPGTVTRQSPEVPEDGEPPRLARGETVVIIVAREPADTTPPTVSITSPEEQDQVSASQVVTLTAEVEDNKEVAGVQFKIDGQNFGDELTSAPYTRQWETAVGDVGDHVITAVARDATGNETESAAVTVTVVLIGPPPPPPPPPGPPPPPPDGDGDGGDGGGDGSG